MRVVARRLAMIHFAGSEALPTLLRARSPGAEQNRQVGRVDRSAASVGQRVPSTFQSANAMNAVAIINASPTIVTAYNATLRWAAQA